MRLQSSGNSLPGSLTVMMVVVALCGGFGVDKAEAPDPAGSEAAGAEGRGLALARQALSQLYLEHHGGTLIEDSDDTNIAHSSGRTSFNRQDRRGSVHVQNSGGCLNRECKARISRRCPGRPVYQAAGAANRRR
jgi:hypothetical protein